MKRNTVIALAAGLVVGFLLGGMMSQRYVVSSATRPNDSIMIDTWTGRSWYESSLVWYPFRDLKKESVTDSGEPEE